MIFEKLEKLRRSSYATKQRFAALFTILVVALVTLIWFIFFANSILSNTFQKSPGGAASTTSATGL